MNEWKPANLIEDPRRLFLQRYVAFLRGINVGGKNLVKMEALRKAFESAGFKNVSTLKASGNVVFESDSAPESASIEDALNKALGFHSSVLLRKFDEIGEIVRGKPFKKLAEGGGKFYVTFMAKSPARNLEIPVVSSRGDMEIISKRKLEAFSVSRPIDGRSGFPNLLVEDKTGVACTTRDWNTILAISALQ